TDRLFDWQRPINFFGKVLDERGQPIEGAQAHFGWNDVSAKGSSEANTASDAQGTFSLTGVNGKVLTVSITKEGYFVSRTQDRFNFEYANPYEPHFHKPDPDTPVIFHLRKKGPAEPLIHNLKLFKFEKNGRTHYLDLFEGVNKLTAPGDLLVHFSVSELNADRKFDWSLTLEAADGGLVESNEEFMFLAPANGYQSTIE